MEDRKAEKLKIKGNLEKAIRAYQKAIEQNPSFYSYHHGLGELLSKKLDWEGAIASYEKAIKLNPSSVWSYNNLGELFGKQGNLDSSVNCYRKAIGIEPEYYGFYKGLGEIFTEKGVLDKAARLFEKAAELYPKLGSNDGGYSEYYYLLAQANLNKGQWEQAVESCREAIALNPKNWQYYQTICQCFQQLEKWDEAIAYYEKAIELNPSDEKIYWFGEVLERQGKLKKAIAVYQQGVENFPKNAEMASHLQVLKGKETLSQTYLNLADTLAKEGHLEEAIKAYHSSINFNPELLEGEASTKNVVISPSALTDKVNHLDKICALENQVYLIEVEPEKQNYIELPKTIPEKGHSKFLIFASAIQKPVFMAVIPEGRCVVLHEHHKSLFNRDNLLLKELCISKTDPTWFSESFQPLLEEDEILYLLTSYSKNYFHWMFEVIAPLQLLHKTGLDRKCKIAIDYSEISFQKETLKTLGLEVDNPRIVNIQKYSHIKAKRLIVPQYGGEKVMGWSCEFLRKKFLPERSEGKFEAKRLYISRQKASFRRVINESEVLEFLEKFGFINLALESISVREQALLLANTEAVIAPHGAGLTNLVFSSPGTKVIEIFSPEWIKPYFYRVGYYCGLDYYYLIGEKYRGKNRNFWGRYADIIVDIDLLSQLMKKAGII